MDEQTMHQLGKVELHCHLDGSLSLEMIRKLAARINLALPADDESLRKLVTAPPDATDLMDYLKPFDFIRPLLQTKEALSMAAYDVVAQAAAENVRYIEVRFAPILSMDEGLSASDTIDAVVTGLHRGMAQFDIIARALVCGMRQFPAASNDAMFKQASSHLGHGLVGGDFAGNEADFPPAVLQTSIQKAQRLGMPLTLHAGECHCAENIYLALQLGIQRIGHATALTHEPKVIQAFVDRGATAELCLTSNLQTRAATSLADFPYQALRAAGAKITINTDNRTVSNTTLTREYWLFAQNFGVTIADLWQFNHDAVAAAFCTEAQKALLHQRLDADYRPYL